METVEIKAHESTAFRHKSTKKHQKSRKKQARRDSGRKGREFESRRLDQI